VSKTDHVLQMTRESLLDALMAQKAEADKRDAKALAAHRKKEQAALRSFRQTLREALAWDYDEVRRREFVVGGYRWRNDHDIDRCPRSLAKPYQDAIDQVRLDARKTYRLRAGGHLFNLVTRKWDAPADLCG
jgi:hypothetical protein